MSKNSTNPFTNHVSTGVNLWSVMQGTPNNTSKPDANKLQIDKQKKDEDLENDQDKGNNQIKAPSLNDRFAIGQSAVGQVRP